MAAALILLWVLSTAIEFHPPIRDERPVGTAEDIRQLAEREDLNVLFILIDTLRADHLGSYGYERETSPTLDEFAATGIRFGRHLAQSSWTKCSMASLWTGLYPMRTGVTRFDHMVTDEATMPAERLREAGYRTIGLYRNGWVAPTFGFEQGFEVYERPPRRNTTASKVRAQNPTISVTGTDQDSVAAGIEFLRVSGHDGRWFLYMHMMDVHEYLYDEESAIFGSRYVDKYDSSVRWTDGTLKILFEYLTEFDLADNTLVVIASDHGEAFRERGLEGHARAVYRESTEIPFLLRLPFRLENPVVIPTRTQNVDVWPTIFDLIGLDPLGDDLDGRSRVPEILAAAEGEDPIPEDEIGIAFLDSTWGKRATESVIRIAVTEDELRYVRTPAPDPDGEAREELFDAALDPHEFENVASERPEVVARLRAIADRELEALPAWGEAPTRELKELELNQLRALGYAIP